MRNCIVCSIARQCSDHRRTRRGGPCYPSGRPFNSCRTREICKSRHSNQTKARASAAPARAGAVLKEAVLFGACGCCACATTCLW
jgi:hypothetical protein